MDLSRSFSATRSRIIGEIRERQPFVELSDVTILSRGEATRIANARGWATRVAGGHYRFDWTVAERALGRPLGALEQRMLRESAMIEPDDDDDEPDEAAVTAASVRRLVDRLNEVLPPD